MKQRRFSLFLLPACAVALGGTILLAGCGGGGGNGNGGGSGNNGSSTGGGTTPPTLMPAEASLNSLVRSTNTVTITNLTATVSQFDQARQADPTNKDAQLGYAISEFALAGAQAANLNGTVIANLRTPKAASAVPALRVGQLAQGLTLWKLPQFLAGSGSAALWPRAADFLPTSVVAARTVLKPRATVTPAQVQTALTGLDASLVKVEQALSVVAADPNYTYTLADPNQPTNTSATVKVGSAEIQILLAAVGAVRSLDNLGLTYNADPGTFNFNATVPASALAGGSFAPAAYLPPSPFLTLNADGAARAGAVKTELNAVAVAGVAAIEAVKTRSNSGYLLDPGTLVTSAQLTTVEGHIQTYQGLLSGPQNIPLTVNGQTVSTSVNIGAFLSRPPADLKALLPILAVSTDSGGTTSLTFSRYPDPTFGGIFPNGVPMGSAAQFAAGFGGGISATYSDVALFAISGLNY